MTQMDIPKYSGSYILKTNQAMQICIK